jgi:hypothetical protein
LNPNDDVRVTQANADRGGAFWPMRYGMPKRNERGSSHAQFVMIVMRSDHCNSLPGRLNAPMYTHKTAV